jgi:uncharacterized membrane protein (Fun14 family)
MNAFSISSLSLPGRVAARPSVVARRAAKRVAPPATCFGNGGGGNFNNNNGSGGGSGGSGGSGGGSGDDCDDDCPIDWRWNPRVNALALTVASATLTHAPNAFAGSKKGGKNKPEDLLDKIDFAELSKLFGTEFGISGVVGLGVGILGKTVAKFSIMVLASVYAFLRWLELNDIIDVKWKNLERLVGKTSRVVLDVNKDGKVDEKDIYAAKAKAVGFLSSAVPSAAGLSAGIMLGLRIG